MIKKIITLIIIIGFIAGCSKDRLVIAPKNQTLESNFYKTPEELRSALISAYDPISWVFYYGASTWITLNVASDDANAGGTPGGQDLLQYQNADKFTLIPSTTNGSESLWRKYYAGIYRANIVLEKAKADDDSMIEIRAEAKFLRAYYYFDLVRFFGDVVLLDHTVTTEYSLSRTPANKIYEFIVKDLTEAIPDLPDKNELTSDQLYRATKSAAQALLGKVYLFMSSPANNYGNYYQNAADLFGSIIHSGIYDLFTDYDMSFDAHHKHGIESLFEIQYTDAFQSTFNYDANTGYSFDESSVDFNRAM